MNILYLDLETTGLQTGTDRIVELAFILEKTDGSVERYESLVNPQMPIPSEVVAIHHIDDEKVKDAPKLGELAEKIRFYVEQTDVFAGYNVLFDLKVLMAETRRVGENLDFHSKQTWDMQKIFFHYEPRHLAAAYQYYCDKELIGAHSASADIEATREIFLAQKEKYQMNLSDSETVDLCSVNLPLDSNGAFAANKNNELCFTFGKHKGKLANPKIQEVKNYLAWITGANFPPDTKAIARALLKGKTVTKENLSSILSE
jgi:DNA polymerase III subunit epsilon